MTDTTKLVLLADFIEKRTDLPFDMRGLATCYVQFASILFNWPDHVIPSTRPFASEMGMDPEEARMLCCRCDWANPDETQPWGGTDEQLGSITRQQAVAHLRMLAGRTP